MPALPSVRLLSAMQFFIRFPKSRAQPPAPRIAYPPAHLVTSTTGEIAPPATPPVIAPTPRLSGAIGEAFTADVRATVVPTKSRPCTMALIAVPAAPAIALTGVKFVWPDPGSHRLLPN